MATFITVAQRALTQLLEANRRQTAANRLGLAKQAKAVAMPAPAPVRINPSRRVTLASEQLAAFRRSRFRQLSHAFYQFDPIFSVAHPSYPTFEWQVYSGDLSASIADDAAFEIPPVDLEPASVTTDVADLFLPVDGQTAILVLMIRLETIYRASFSPGVFVPLVTVANRAYVLNKTAIRQVNIPAGLQSIIDLLNPNNPADNNVESYPDGDNTSGFAPRVVYAGDTGLYQPYLETWRSPALYELLDRISSFASLGDIKQFPASLNWVTPDLQYGLWSGSITDKSLYFADWLGDPTAIDPEQTQYLRPLPRSTYVLPSAFAYPGYGPGYARLVAWDWDDPAYCKRMCALLGFSGSDFAP